MKKAFLIAILGYILIFPGCIKKNSNIWIGKFINYNGTLYLVTDEKIKDNHVGKALGTVKYYSTKETDSRSESNLLSNYFMVGTTIYSIEDVDICKAIAVKDDDKRLCKTDR